MTTTANQNRYKHLLKPTAARPWHMTGAVLFSFALVLLFPQAAFPGPMGDFLGFFTGSSFYCVGPVHLGDLYNNGIADCSTLGIDHLFSGFVCQFEQLVSDIFGEFYCSLLNVIELPLSAFLTLFVTFIGVGFLTSYLQFTAKQVVMILFKIALVWALATQADFVVSYLFNGFIFFMQATVYAVLRSLMSSPDIMDPGSMFFTDSLFSNTGQGLFAAMDKIINDLVSNSINAQMVTGTDPNDPTKTFQVPSFAGGDCANDPIKIVFAIALSMPSLFMILGMTVIKLGMVLLRTLLGYLLCITGVMFLLTLSPIFLSLGLFQITKGFFVSWLQLITGFAVQVFIMFAFLALALGMLSNSQFGDYKGLVMNWGQEYMHDSIKFGGTEPDPGKGFFCTLCDIDPDTLNISFAKGEGVKCKEPKTPIPPTALYSSNSIVEMLSIKIFTLALIAYLFESILAIAPEVARALSMGVGAIGSDASVAPITPPSASTVPGKGHFQAGKGMVRQATTAGRSGSLVTEALKGMLGMR